MNRLLLVTPAMLILIYLEEDIIAETAEIYFATNAPIILLDFHNMVFALQSEYALNVIQYVPLIYANKKKKKK